jgi:hypothetical protein
MNVVASIASSAVVAALVGALAAYLSQRALAARNARLTYEFAARKRLYEALGPLRFQLILACKDLLRRVSQHQHSRWNLDPRDYYGHSFVYRLLRPLAVCVLIERETNYSDFAVDRQAIDLLRFQSAAYRMLVDDDPLPYYQGLDWATQSQHVFRDNLRAAAMRLVSVDAAGRAVVLDYSRFREECPDPLADPAIAPLARLFRATDVSLAQSPVLWARITGYTFAAQTLLNSQGPALGFGRVDLDVAGMLAATEDSQITEHLDDYPAIFETVVAQDL